MDITAHLMYGAAWASFGLVHSLLASEWVKARLSAFFGRGYRLAYNALSTLHVIGVLACGYELWPGAAPFGLPGWLQGAMIAMIIGGGVIFVIALRHYDLGLFAGTAQWRGRADNTEPLLISGLHRFVRHPLYLGGGLMIWGLASDERAVATAVWACIYLAIGIFFEERKLLARHGVAYERYRHDVPAVVPSIKLYRR